MDKKKIQIQMDTLFINFTSETSLVSEINISASLILRWSSVANEANKRLKVLAISGSVTPFAHKEVRQITKKNCFNHI